MIKLYNKQTNEFLGRIQPAQLKFLSDRLEEESLDDRDYYITRATLDQFEQEGVDENLLMLLRSAMKPADFVEIRWEEEEK
jgi:hypothetical protein